MGLRSQTPAQLVKDTTLWTLIGLFTVITSGLLIFTSDPLRYYYNPTFRFKLECLVVAVIYNYAIHRKVALSSPSLGVGVVVEGISVVLAGGRCVRWSAVRVSVNGETLNGYCQHLRGDSRYKLFHRAP